MSCAWLTLLADPTVPPAMGSEVADERCVAFDVDVAGRVTEGRPQVGLYRSFSVPRGRVESAFSDGPVTARIGFGMARSGGETGYLGIDGEAIVPVLQVAEARLSAPTLGIAASAGLIDDPWVVSGERAWGLNAVASPFASQSGWLERSDLGMRVGLTTPDGFVTVSGMLASGEGYRRRERNVGWSSTAMATARPLATVVSPEALEISFLGRDGSRGLEYARDHRLGLRISTRLDLADAGVEGLIGKGIDGDPDREPTGGSAWLVMRPFGPLDAFARYDTAREIPGDPKASWSTVRAGVGTAWPLKAEHAPAHLRLGFETGSAGETAAPVAGGDGLTSWTRVWLQLEVRMRGAVALTAKEEP